MKTAASLVSLQRCDDAFYEMHVDETIKNLLAKDILLDS